MATGYAYIDREFWLDADFRTAPEKLLAIYIFAHSDAAGVMAWDRDHVKGTTRVSKQRATAVLDRFVALGKARRSDDGLWIWWRSKIKYFLQKGSCSGSQRKAVQLRLHAWDRQGVFGPGFAEYVRQVYLDLYRLRIDHPGAVVDTPVEEPPAQLKLDGV